VKRSDFRYHPFYCEENAWLLAADPRLAALDRWMIFITNSARSCLLFHQRAGGPHGQVVWDYHVIVAASSGSHIEVYDLDTTLDFPVLLPDYVAHTFTEVASWPDIYRPRFKVVPAEDALRRFASDRRHMRRTDGSWQASPPPWPTIQGADAPHNLDRWLDVDERAQDDVYDVHTIASAFTRPSR